MVADIFFCNSIPLHPVFTHATLFNLQQYCSLGKRRVVNYWLYQSPGKLPVWVELRATAKPREISALEHGCILCVELLQPCTHYLRYIRWTSCICWTRCCICVVVSSQYRSPVEQILSAELLASGVLDLDLGHASLSRHPPVSFGALR